MKLRLCFFMLALGICGAVVQGCDDKDLSLIHLSEPTRP